jgi:pyruvate kinase
MLNAASEGSIEMRRTKIVCTIGPATESPEAIRRLIDAGMNVARVNFAHNTHAWHAERIREIRRSAEARGQPVAVLQDLAGPKIRLGEIPGSGVEIRQDQQCILTPGPTVIERRSGIPEVNLPVPALLEALRPGHRLWVDDGRMQLQVESRSGEHVLCKALDAGILSTRKGINAPGVGVDLPAITERDLTDVRRGIELGVDWVAASFVRSAADLRPLRELMATMGASVPIIAKIESHQALPNLEEVIDAADGVMVARGDMGLEMPVEDVPIVQKRIIRLSNAAGKPVITATQMLDSMSRRPFPSRAEVTDVANAIFDGTDAVMLSAETAIGQFPILTVETMARIVERTEQDLDFRALLTSRLALVSDSISEAIAQGTAEIASDLNAAAIITSTASGRTSRLVSKMRPHALVVGATERHETYRRLALSWGVTPLLVPESRDTDTRLRDTVAAARAAHLVHDGDLVVITAGVPVGVPGRTNLIKVQRVGEEENANQP